MSYCAICGNTGITIDGEVCSCRSKVSNYFAEVSCLEVPDSYRGVMFNSFLLPKDVDDSYAKYLDSVSSRISTGKWESHNVIIASPVGHGKTILAYSCLETLFRAGYPIFPLYDVLELKRMLLDLDMCRKQVYDVENPEMIVTVPILFVRIPRVSDWEVYNTISLILDRRVRRGNSTIFLYNGTWNQLIYGDKSEILAGLQGDGNYGTIEVKSWNVLTKSTGITVPDNIG